jgi:mitogen-activated protein kinase 1/3
MFIVMENFGVDLKTVLSCYSECLTDEHITLILYNLLCSLRFLHQSNVMHRDIKSSNILVDEDCNVKICDFGLSRSIPTSCIGKGSGNTKRMRDSILKSDLSSKFDEEEISKVITKKLLNEKAIRQSKKRSLSNHIGTRWYRAPEIITIEN